MVTTLCRAEPLAQAYEIMPASLELELQLLSVLLKRHPDQLASCPNASFGEELLQSSFDCSLGNLQSIGDLLVGQSFKDK